MWLGYNAFTPQEEKGTSFQVHRLNRKVGSTGAFKTPIFSQWGMNVKWLIRTKFLSVTWSWVVVWKRDMHVSSVLDVLQRWCQGESRLAECWKIIDIPTLRLLNGSVADGVSVKEEKWQLWSIGDVFPSSSTHGLWPSSVQELCFCFNKLSSAFYSLKVDK